MSYTCTGCGSESVEINSARPSIDDRYPIGHCFGCTPWPRMVQNPLDAEKWIQPPRKTIALIRSDLFDRDDFNHRRKVAEMRRLANKLNGKSVCKMSKPELEKARKAVEWLQRDDAA